MSVFRRYVLLEVPGWVLAAAAVAALHRWAGLPGWAAVALLVVWIGKDFALYPWLRAAYEIDTRTTAEQQLVGARGVATQSLTPGGHVRVRGELWRAEVVPADHHVDAGAEVEVIGVSGMTLMVTRVTSASSVDQ